MINPNAFVFTLYLNLATKNITQFLSFFNLIRKCLTVRIKELIIYFIRQRLWLMYSLARLRPFLLGFNKNNFSSGTKITYNFDFNRVTQNATVPVNIVRCLWRIISCIYHRYLLTELTMIPTYYALNTNCRQN